nr:atherin-like [Aegilops tauschii subsp. strangulata]
MLARPAPVPPRAGFPARRLEREAVRLACPPADPAGSGPGAWRLRLPARRPGRLRPRCLAASPARPPTRPTPAPELDGVACPPAAPADSGPGACRPRLLARRPGRLWLRSQAASPARPPRRSTPAPVPGGLACPPATPADSGPGARRPRLLARLRPPRGSTAPDPPPPPPRAAPARRSPAPLARPRASSAPRRLAASPAPTPVACPTSRSKAGSPLPRIRPAAQPARAR